MSDVAPTHEPGRHPDQPPPVATVGVLGWLRKNLFSSWLNSIITIVAVYFLYVLVPPIVDWVVTSSVVSGSNRSVCDMGRALSRMGEAMERADLAAIESEATQDRLVEVTDFYAQFASRVGNKKDNPPDDITALAEEIDLKATRKDLDDAIAKKDAARIESQFQRLAPLVEWGSVRDGACWTFIAVWFDQIIYGRYPAGERWRVNLAFLILIVSAVPLFVARFKHKGWVGAYLLLIYPVIAYYLFTGFSRDDILAWAFRTMGFAAFALGLLALMPHAGVWRERSKWISIALIVLLPLWGVSASSTWTGGILAGGPAWAGALTVLLAIAPPLIVVGGLMLPRWRAEILARFWQLAVAVGILAFIGGVLPLLFWDDVVGPTAPWSMAVVLAAFAMAAVCPWGYDKGSGLPGRIAALLLPAYLGIAYMIFVGPPDFFNFGFLDWAWTTRSTFAAVAGALPVVETPLWGGLFVTLVIAGVGIVASLPIGIVLALGRRSKMPIMRIFSVVFIEVWRGVPLISVLFMASVMFPLFLPEGMNFDKLLRALVGVALFASAYMAEVVRAGLQAIPRGQYEAAQALGLNYPRLMALIILPQALKMVIPGIVNTFIGLFKDTTLVLIIGLFDLLGMVQLAATNPNWLGFSEEGYVFAGFGFWLFCFAMSRYSQFVERKLHTGH